MRKKIVYIAGILALGVVIFNNTIQSYEILRSNQDYLIAFMLSLIGSLTYGIMNL